jgi:hypothetical protein
LEWFNFLRILKLYQFFQELGEKATIVKKNHPHGDKSNSVDNMKCPFLKDNMGKNLLVEKNLDDSLTDLIDLAKTGQF